MRQLLLLGAIFLGLAAPASAHGPAGRALLGAQALAHATVAAPAAHCPAGVPVQTITVVNQAHARRLALARVEHAVTNQSMQLRAAWGTPCVTWGPGGWPLYLRVGGTEWGVHYTEPVRAYVYTAGLPYQAWSQVFSHEVVEMLVDPDTVRSYYEPDHGDAGTWFGSVEVADPVGERAYKLGGVWVSDFVFPAYYAGALSVPPPGCDPTQQVACGAPLAAADAAAPYDQMGLLTAPWQTTWAEIA